MKPTYRRSWAGSVFLLQGQMRIAKLDVVTFGLGPLHQSQTRTAKLKSVYNLLIIGPRGLER